jgi:hypothetical protein
MLDDPISQSSFETYVPARFFGLNPFMLKDFVPLGLKFPVERRIPQQIVVCRSQVFRFVRHNRRISCAMTNVSIWASS